MSHRRSACFTLGLTVLAAAGPMSAAPAARVPNRNRSQLAAPSGRLGPELFWAIQTRNVPEVRALIARGADLSANNSLGFNPLLVAVTVGQPDVIHALIAAGAKVDAACPLGTPLYWAAASGHTDAAKLLLARGAGTVTRRVDKISPLMVAAYNGDEELVRVLLEKKADVHALDLDGETALVHAARRGHAGAARLLLARGAKVSTRDSRGWTALMHAAQNGGAEVASVLLAAGADVNARDAAGQTPLLLAANYAGTPDVVKVLLNAGADPNAKDSRGRSVLQVAARKGFGAVVELLRERGAQAVAAQAAEETLTPRAAARKSLRLMERSMQIFARRTGCTSCHQEGMGLVAMGLARERGYKIDPAFCESRAEKTREFLNLPFMRPAIERAGKDVANAKYVPAPDLITSNGSMLWGAAALNRPSDPGFAAAAVMVARLQTPAGFWPLEMPRVPMDSTPIGNTAKALRILHAYAPREAAAEVAERAARARAWLLKVPAATSDELSFRLLGLKWAGATAEERAASVKAIFAAQGPDGGWSQVPGGRSDAYATGQALYALHVGGEVPTADPAYRKGVAYLLRTQDDDGSWFVAKRAIPGNNYFDAGFPHGESQYISFTGTSWATMALILADERAGRVSKAK